MKRRNPPAPRGHNAPWRCVREISGPDGIAATLYLGDCVQVMKALEPQSLHAVVTDPPYEIGFLGKSWDKVGVASDVATWEAAFDLLKPGGHLTSFAAARTYHRIVCAIEAAGFDIRDQLIWLYGSGFPKSHDIAKAIDKRDGRWRGKAVAKKRDEQRAFGQHYERSEKGAAVSADAQAWDGWGTALKPAHEPIALARRPFSGAVSDNVLAHGTGALNVDACKVGSEFLPGQAMGQPKIGGFEHNGIVTPDRIGRWPANVMHDGSMEVLEAFPPHHRPAARFFYSAKASKADRDFGLDGLAARKKYDRVMSDSSIYAKAAVEARNIHPTVKPSDLMAWLCRLVTAPGGLVLDPFMGSGSTGLGAVRHGFRFIGIEQSEEYFDIATRRITAAVEAEAAMPRIEREITRAVRAVQLGMFEGTTEDTDR